LPDLGASIRWWQQGRVSSKIQSGVHRGSWSGSAYILQYGKVKKPGWCAAARYVRAKLLRIRGLRSVQVDARGFAARRGWDDGASGILQPLDARHSKHGHDHPRTRAAAALRGSTPNPLHSNSIHSGPAASRSFAASTRLSSHHRRHPLPHTTLLQLSSTRTSPPTPKTTTTTNTTNTTTLLRSLCSFLARPTPRAPSIPNHHHHHHHHNHHGCQAQHGSLWRRPHGGHLLRHER
jgi:hypothetical protein